MELCTCQNGNMLCMQKEMPLLVFAKHWIMKLKILKRIIFKGNGMLQRSLRRFLIYLPSTLDARLAPLRPLVLSNMLAMRRRRCMGSWLHTHKRRNVNAEEFICESSKKSKTVRTRDKIQFRQ